MRILPGIHRPPQIAPKPIVLRPQPKVISLDAYRAQRALVNGDDRPTPPGLPISRMAA